MHVATMVTLAPILCPENLLFVARVTRVSSLYSCLLLCASVFVIVTKEVSGCLDKNFLPHQLEKTKMHGTRALPHDFCWRREQLVQQSQMNSSNIFVHIIW